MSLKLLITSVLGVAILLASARYLYNDPAPNHFGLSCCFVGILYIVLTPFLNVWAPLHAHDERHMIELHDDHSNTSTSATIWTSEFESSPSPPSTPFPPQSTLPRRSPRKSKPPVRFIDEFVRIYNPKIWVEVPRRHLMGYRCHLHPPAARASFKPVDGNFNDSPSTPIAQMLPSPTLSSSSIGGHNLRRRPDPAWMEHYDLRPRS